MTRSWPAELLLPALFLTTVSAAAEAQGSTPADTGAGAAPSAPAAERKSLRWRNTNFVWAHRATTQTLGIGDDYQSSNPYYEWVFGFSPRYYFLDEDRTTVSLRLQVGASTELTNSDSTTRRNELLLSDSTLSLVQGWTLAEDGEMVTRLSLSAPRLVLPTSRASYAGGSIVEAGLGVTLEQAFPLRSGEDFLPRGAVNLRLSYAHLFSRAIVPVNSDLEQPRTDLGGHSVRSDQLGGAAFAEHKAGVHVRGDADLWKDRLSALVEVGVDPVWKYPLPEGTVANVATGPVLLESRGDERFAVISYFNVEASLYVIGDILSVSVGYENITLQLGPNGQRRSLLYSPDAVLYAGLDLALDELYLDAIGQPSPKKVGSAR